LSGPERPDTHTECDQSDRERFLEALVGMATVPLFGCSGSTESAAGGCEGAEAGVFEVTRSETQWRDLLGDDRFFLLRQSGTETPYTSPLDTEERAGTFICGACSLPLFRSEVKYDSHTGWPSFWQPIDGQLGLQADCQLSALRIEYHCARCGGHQGHIFPDGPLPTGQRWCNNGASLDFVLDGEPLPELLT